MEKTSFILTGSLFFSKWSPNIFSVMDILISLLIIFIFYFNIRERVKWLLNCVFKRRDEIKTFNPLTQNVWDKVLKKNRAHHLNSFFLVNSFFFLVFLSKEELKIQDSFPAIIVSAVLFTVSYFVSEKRLIDYREENSKINTK